MTDPAARDRQHQLDERIGEIRRGFEPRWKALVSRLKALEARRQRSRIVRVVLFLLGIGTVPVAYYLGPALALPPDAAKDLLNISVVVGAILVIFGVMLDDDSRFRAIREVRRAVFEHLGWEHQAGRAAFPVDPFLDAGLIPGADRVTTTERITGFINEVPFTLCKVHLENKASSFGLGLGGFRKSITQFRGVLFASAFPKTIRARTSILPTGMSRPQWATGIARLEAPAFQSLYTVYTTDQVEARYLLTLRLIERLLRLHVHVGAGVRTGFGHDRMMLAIPTSHDWFGADMPTAGFADPRLVEAIIRDTLQLVDIVETLNLDSKSRI